MTRRTRLTALAATGALACAVAVPALSGAQQSGSRDVTVLMKVQDGHEIHHAKKPKGKFAPGDQLIVRLAMFDTGGARTGSAYLSCVGVGKKTVSGKATLQCMQTYKFNDGQIVAVGVVRFEQIDKLSVAIAGGSGAHKGASGDVTSGTPPKGYDSADILHLEG